MNAGIGHLKYIYIYMVSPIATFSKHGNRAYPKNVVKNTYKCGYRLKLRLLKTWL